MIFLEEQYGYLSIHLEVGAKRIPYKYPSSSLSVFVKFSFSIEDRAQSSGKSLFSLLFSPTVGLTHVLLFQFWCIVWV